MVVPFVAFAMAHQADLQSNWSLPPNLSLQQVGCAGPIELSALQQESGIIRQGSASVFCNPSAQSRGTVTGTIAGNTLTIIIDWGCVKRPWPLDCQRSVGVYEGTVNAQGYVEGFTYDRMSPDAGRAAWRSVQPLSSN